MRPRQGSLTIGLCSLVLWLALVPRAEAARLVGVRVDVEGDRTMIVLELDAPASYRVEPVRSVNGGAELAVTIGATSEARSIGPKGDLLRALTLDPRPDGSIVRIRLRHRGVQVRDRLLSGPTRLVLELRSLVASEAAAPPPAPSEPPVLGEVPRPAAPASPPAPQPSPGPGGGPYKGIGSPWDEREAVELDRQVEGVEREPAETPITANGAKESAEPSSEAVPVYWNSWAERSGNPDVPLDFLVPNREYELRLDLAALQYEIAKHSGVSQRASPDTLGFLKDSKEAVVALDILLLVDREHFRPPAEDQRLRRAKFTVAKIKDYVPGPRPANVFEELRGYSKRGETPPFRFNDDKVSFPLRPLGESGPTSVALSFWTTDGIQPVDELTIPLCVAVSEADAAARCAGERAKVAELSGLDSLRVATQGARPDAALHFVELQSETLVGVFRDNSEPSGKFHTWLHDASTSEIEAKVQELVASFKTTAPRQALVARGRALFETLFRCQPKPCAPERDVARARDAFRRFVFAEGADGPAKRRSLFMRTLVRSEVEKSPIPIGLAAFASGEGKPAEFVAERVRVEYPLPVQHYEEREACVEDWVLALPSVSGDPTLAVAAKRVGPAVERWRGRLAGRPDALPPTMAALSTWLDGGTSGPTSLFVLSHHASDELYATASDLAPGSLVARSFARPSAAVLNGCVTSPTGAFGFVRSLNSLGVDSIIATLAEVDPEIAGDFSACFACAVEAHPKAELGTVHADALGCLAKRSPTMPPLDCSEPPAEEASGAYGPRAFAYLLLGNANLRLCPPPEGNP